MIREVRNGTEKTVEVGFMLADVIYKVIGEDVYVCRGFVPGQLNMVVLFWRHGLTFATLSQFTAQHGKEVMEITDPNFQLVLKNS